MAETAADAAPGIEYLQLKGGQVPWTVLDWEGFTCRSHGAHRLAVDQWGVMGCGRTYKAGSGWWESARLFDHIGV